MGEKAKIFFFLFSLLFYIIIHSNYISVSVWLKSPGSFFTTELAEDC